MKLAAAARERWPEFDGWAAARNVEPLDLDLDRYLNLVYFFLTQDPQIDRGRLDAWLTETAPETVTEDDPVWSAEAEMKAFGQFQSGLSTGL